MAAEVIHNHDVAGTKRGDKDSFDIDLEGLTVDRTLKKPRRLDPIETQRSQERRRVPVTVRDFGYRDGSHWTITDLVLAERLQNARRKKLIVGCKSWILPAMNGCSPNQQPRKGTAHEALLRPRRLLHGPAHRGSRSRTHLRSRAG